jgi:hypothetical protein
MERVVRGGISPSELGRATAWALLLGGVCGLVVSVAHPRGHPVEMAAAIEAWTMIHVFGAVGFGLLATAALIELGTRERTPARSTVETLGLAGATVFGVMAMITMTIDGFTNPVLASLRGIPGAESFEAALLGMESGLAAIGYGGFGIAAALAVTARLFQLRGTAARAAAAIAALALLSFAMGAILYIGMGIQPLGVLMAPSPLAMAWFVFAGLRGVRTRELRPREAPPGAG